VGSVEMGSDLKPILDEIKLHSQFEYAIGIYEDTFKLAGRKESTSDIKNKNIIYYDYSDKNIKEIIDRYAGKNFYRVNNKNYYISDIPIKDYTGNEVGHLLIYKDYSDLLALNKSELYRSIIFIIIVGLGAILVLYFYINSIIKQLKVSVEIAKELSKGSGDFSKRIPIKIPDYGKLTGIADEDLIYACKEKPCWLSIGDFANYRKCSLLVNGKVSKCDECKVFSTACSDEVCQMAVWINIFIELIEKYFTDIMINMYHVMGSAPEMWQNVYVVNEINERNVNMASQTAAAGEEMSSTISEIANGVNEVSNKSSVTQNLALNGNTLVDESSRYADEIQGAILNLKKNINELVTNASNIGSVVGVINEISEQTNLLALNAAIEAARAGEHGRGFAVVADEVRKLAEKTRKSTKEIESMIRDMQIKVKSVDQEVDVASGFVENQHSIAKKLQESFGTILNSIEELNQYILSISTALEQQSKATDEIARSVSDISSSSMESKEKVIILNQSIQQLLGEAKKVLDKLNSYNYSAEGVIFIRAKIAHIDFINKLYNAIIFRKTYDVVDHRNCNFGLFYYSDGVKLFGSDDDFKAIENSHIKVHELGRKAMELMKSGKFDDAHNIMIEMEKPLHELNRHLDNLIQKHL
jgi:methyl-accepting chemotaxis protein